MKALIALVPRALAVVLLPAALLATHATTAQETDRLFDPDRPAREVYENIKLFVSDRVTASDLDRLMDEISIDLGVSCTHCHDARQLHRDDLERAKVRARELIPHMWGVVSQVNRDHFPGAGAPVRCWTCHRGSSVPEREPPDRQDVAHGLVPDPFEGGRFENLQELPGDPDELRRTMLLFVTALGAECTDCHTVGNWASDTKELKLRARTMLNMVDTIDRELFSELRSPTCWTCHRGSRKPEFLRPGA